MSTVFITQENHRIDFSAAELHGDIKFITAQEFMSINGAETNDRILAQMKEKLRKFDYQDDSLLLSGNPIFMMHCVVYIFHVLQVPAIRILHWNGQFKKYNKYILNPSDLANL